MAILYGAFIIIAAIVAAIIVIADRAGAFDQPSLPSYSGGAPQPYGGPPQPRSPEDEIEQLKRIGEEQSRFWKYYRDY